MKACVIGAGSWGTAFALHLARLGIETRLWVREREIFESLESRRQNNVFLPGCSLPSEVAFFTKIPDALLSAGIVFVAVPSQFCRTIYTRMAPHLSSSHTIVSLTKGIEEESLKRMSEVMDEVFSPVVHPRLAVLSGPSFAKEIAELHPTAVVVASRDLAVARQIQHLVSNVNFRAYTTEDIIGVELGGALKNIIAIAAGISDGLDFGHNSRAAIITRGLREIMRLGTKLGAKSETFFGLAGIGDLVLTCTSKLSRNYGIGYEIGKGRSLAEVMSRTKMVAEGVKTTHSAHLLSVKKGVEIPICEQVYNILYRKKDPKKSLHDLMTRTLRYEGETIPPQS